MAATKAKPGEIDTVIIAICNHKGGVTKTTTAINLADNLAKQGEDTSVVLVDMDPQANASIHIGVVHPMKVSKNLAELMLQPNPNIATYIFDETSVEGVSLIYGSMSLENVPDVIRHEAARPNEVLKERLKPLIGHADYIILDCPPNLGLLTMNALAAATHYIIPVESGASYALYGLADLQQRITKIKQINPELDFLGALLAKHDKRMTLCQETESDAEQLFGKVLPVYISPSTKVNQSVAVKLTVGDLDKRNPVAKQYAELAAYVAKQTKGKGRKP
ncbi:ParA family protein [Pseudomonas sp. LS-2]|uniref:ParA family protein n=1 Tax=Pseudomonas sp. LS-2 TaxID=2315859 RepID=UPI000E7415C4|nr:AAA family ATPase [Pseudomonas sp. LS-2]RJX72670.1 ParA family protein [Pseudomonas sp. LS-2]